MFNQWKWSYYLLVKLVEMILLDKMVQPLAQPSKLASGTTENYLTWKKSQAVKIIPLVIIIQLVKRVQLVQIIQPGELIYLVKMMQPLKWPSQPVKMIQLVGVI